MCKWRPSVCCQLWTHKTSCCHATHRGRWLTCCTVLCFHQGSDLCCMLGPVKVPAMVLCSQRVLLAYIALTCHPLPLCQTAGTRQLDTRRRGMTARVQWPQTIRPAVTSSALKMIQSAGLSAAQHVDVLMSRGPVSNQAVHITQCCTEVRCILEYDTSILFLQFTRGTADPGASV
jgi:hypothetical protein